MNNKIEIFKNKDFGQVRTLLIDNEPYFVGKDVAEILGYTTLQRMYDHVEKEDKKKIDPQSVEFAGLCENGITLESNPNVRTLVIINESGLYDAIFGSKLPNAKKFKRWVTSEVLPQIRKTGGYIPVNEEMTDSEIMARALLISQKTIEQKDELLKIKEKELTKTKEDLESKDRFINQIAISNNSFKVEEVAQIANKEGIKIGRNRLWNKLREWGLIKKGTKYDPKQEYIDRGYFEVVEGTKESSKGVFAYKTTRVLGKGQVYIINKLLVEQEAQ